MIYAGIIIDNNTNATDAIYTYSSEVPLRPGQKVKVRFSLHNRLTDGYVLSVSEQAPEDFPPEKIKKIEAIDDSICLTEEAVRTAEWMRNRYLCRYIEAIGCFLPNGEVKGKVRDPLEKIKISESDAAPRKLNADQQAAFDKLSAYIDSGTNHLCLLFGVTGAGKTEVYLQAMERVLSKGQQGIILVPEISLTPQLLSRFVSRFGKENVAVLHSRLTSQQRAVQYKRIESGEAKLIIGARSAVFAPCRNIGMIILDEEHETSYKSDKSPKYDTIEVAAKRAKEHNALLLLGSATPSLADYYRSEAGVFDRIEIKHRYNLNPLPQVCVVDMTNEIKAGNRSLFSKPLAAEMQKCLEEGKQVILFLNRRGYSSHISCRECGYVVSCDDCGISMPYHKNEGACVCHYCGKKKPKPKTCPVCGSKLIGSFGAGTEQLEEKCAELFPGAAAERLDLDSIKKKGELEAILGRFEKKKTNILIGTQLVVKGLDFANVGLVGIISADVSLNIPDFRSQERSFQLIDQAAGRSGRGEESGKVIIQTYQPDNPAVVYASHHDYENFYRHEIQIRQAAGYPPFSDIFQITIQNENSEIAQTKSEKCARWLRKRLGEGIPVLGPSASVLTRQNGMFRYQILIKAPAGTRHSVSATVQELKDIYTKGSVKDGTLLTTDINPFSFM